MHVNSNNMAIAAARLPKPTRFNDGSELKEIAIEVDQLSALGVADITSIGAENIYILKDGLHYYCKVMATDRFKEGCWDFVQNRSTDPVHTLLSNMGINSNVVLRSDCPSDISTWQRLYRFDEVTDSGEVCEPDFLHVLVDCCGDFEAIHLPGSARETRTQGHLSELLSGRTSSLSASVHPFDEQYPEEIFFNKQFMMRGNKAINIIYNNLLGIYITDQEEYAAYMSYMARYGFKLPSEGDCFEFRTHGIVVTQFVVGSGKPTEVTQSLLADVLGSSLLGKQRANNA